jgi:hypothetical protein
MKNLLYTLFLICICFIESNGGIENNISFEDAQAQPTDSVWVTIVNAWSWEVTEQEATMINDFVLDSDSVWSEKDRGWDMIYFTNTAFDTVAVFETDPEGDAGYQLLFYTEE